jgi:hypothetical protein
MASVGLGGRDVAGGDLLLVVGEGCQDFGLLALWNLGEVQAPSEFCCDLIKFCGEMRRSRWASRDYFARALEIFERLGTRREAVLVFFTRQPLELVPASPYDRALYS